MNDEPIPKYQIREKTPDEESITILANQIGSALENARLFEKTWRAHQELEQKVEERTREFLHKITELYGE